jgi:Domain of unknown function (DUF4129)
MILSNLNIKNLFYQRRSGLTWMLLLFLCSWTLLPSEAKAQAADSTQLEELEESSAVVTEPTLTQDEAQEYDDAEYTPPPVAPVAFREADKKQWDDASNNLDYSSDVPKPPKPVKEQEPPTAFPDMSGWNASTAWLGKIFQMLAIVLAIAAIAYGIFRTLQAPRNRRIGQAQDGTVITVENVDAYIHETDLERFLREALAAGNYALCIRLYYLQTIKVLSEKGNIKWSREKTNRDYLREMREHRLGAAFRENTRTFERVWYGNQALSAAAYNELEPGFKGLLGQL